VLVRWSGGVHVVGTRIWCDAARAHGVTFLSGADVKLKGRWERIVATEKTAKLCNLDGVLPAPFGRPFALGRARVELLPAGRIAGSAQLRVEVDGATVIYAGAVDPRGEIQVRGCDELVIALRDPARTSKRLKLGPPPPLEELVEFAAATEAGIVHVTGGFSDEIARAFAKKKLRASPLGPPQQLLIPVGTC
jgi:hypothetical protein